MYAHLNLVLYVNQYTRSRSLQLTRNDRIGPSLNCDFEKSPDCRFQDAAEIGIYDATGVLTPDNFVSTFNSDDID